MRSGSAWVAVVLLVAGCGGGESAETSAAPGGDTLTTSERTALAAEALVDQWGSDRHAFYAVMWSLDAGYSADQIIGAAPEGLIGADGTIAGQDGSIVEPEREPEGLLTEVTGEALGAGVVVAAVLPIRGSVIGLLADESPQDAETNAVGLLSEVFDGGLAAFEAKQAEAATATGQDLTLENVEGITWITLGLGARGYSAEQILEAILLGQWDVFRNADLNYCWRVLSTKRTEIAPAFPASDRQLEGECAAEAERREAATTTSTTSSTSTTTTMTSTTSTTAATTTSEAPLTFPRTYSGGGSTQWSFSYPPPGGCVVEDTLQLTLEEDGTLSGLYQRTAPTFYVTEGGSSLECGDQFFAEEYEVTGSHTPAGAGKSETGVVVVEVAGWPDWHIEGEYTPSEMTFTWELDYPATGYAGDEPDPRVINSVDFDLLLVDEG